MPGAKKMPSPREKRLQTDLQKVQRLAAGSGGALVLAGFRGKPPTAYILEFHCPSLVKEPGGQVLVRHSHRVEIVLGPDYPMTKPTARMLTPVFNPHVFSTQQICLGGAWTPLETLDVLILRIGAILQMDPKVINYSSLANSEAGTWARRNRDSLPLPGWTTFKPPASPPPIRSAPDQV